MFKTNQLKNSEKVNNNSNNDNNNIFLLWNRLYMYSQGCKVCNNCKCIMAKIIWMISYFYHDGGDDDDRL